MIALLLSLSARAGPPDVRSLDVSALRPLLTSPDLHARHAQMRASEGLPPDPLACEPLWFGVAALCVATFEGALRRLLTVSELSEASLDLPELRAQFAAQGLDHSRAAELLPVAGMSASYLRLVDTSGGVASLALRPELLAERLGGLPVRIAAPSATVLVAWRGSPDLDRVMAVGVSELYAQLPDKLSPKILTWDGQRVTGFGQAVPSKDP